MSRFLLGACMRSGIFLVIAVFLSTPVLAEEARTKAGQLREKQAIGDETGKKEELKTIDQLEHEQFMLDGSLLERLGRATRSMELQCMKAFPNERFCRCLASQMPMVLTMTQYTAITTSAREDIGYGEMSDDEKKVIDITIEAREKCATAGM